MPEDYSIMATRMILRNFELGIIYIYKYVFINSSHGQENVSFKIFTLNIYLNKLDILTVRAAKLSWAPPCWII